MSWKDFSGTKGLQFSWQLQSAEQTYSKSWWVWTRTSHFVAKKNRAISNKLNPLGGAVAVVVVVVVVKGRRSRSKDRCCCYCCFGFCLLSYYGYLTFFSIQKTNPFRFDILPSGFEVVSTSNGYKAIWPLLLETWRCCWWRCWWIHGSFCWLAIPKPNRMLFTIGIRIYIYLFIMYIYISGMYCIWI